MKKRITLSDADTLEVVWRGKKITVEAIIDGSIKALDIEVRELCDILINNSILLPKAAHLEVVIPVEDYIPPTWERDAAAIASALAEATQRHHSTTSLN